MKRPNIHYLKSAVSLVCISLLASSAFAQQPTGGWRRVGDPPPADQAQAQTQTSDQPVVNSAADQVPPYLAADANQAPPAGDNQIANQPNYGQATPPVYNQAPNPPVYNQGPNQPVYNQMPNQPSYNYGGQPAYGPPNYNYQAPPPPVPAQLTIPAGTYITARVNQPLSSDKNQIGDAFSATLTQPLVVNGVVIAEPGQTVGGRVALVQRHTVNQPAKLGVQLTTLTLVDGQQVPLNTQLINRQGGTTPGGVEAGTVAATTGLGAAIGAAAGWGTGAAIGAGAGALAGLIGVVVTHNHASLIYPEQILTFQVQSPVTISTSNSQQAFRYVQPNEYDRPYDNAPRPYAAGAPAPYYGAYAYPYAYGYPYYWGPSFGFYYGRGFYRPYVGGRVIVRGGFRR